MRPVEATFRDLRKLHVWLCLSALALLTVTLWMIVSEYRRPWRRYQRVYRALAKSSGADPGRRTPAIEQIWLPELTLDYHFQQVARFDRCTTCHQGISKANAELPQPFHSHPRLNLYVGSLSPHPKDAFGCTICHDGQGNSTSFRWSSHTPNTPGTASRWRREHDWQPAPHWEWPMLPRRFVESRCLQCHHEVTDLEPSDRYPDPPAPKLLSGYHLIRTNGCFGCHEIHGYDAAGRRIGPDIRLEPQGTATDEGPPGTMRKVGPSLRNVAQKLTPALIMDRTADPRRFLPTTRMPRFFGLHAHLSDEARKEAQRFEPVEIRAIATYLLAASEPIEPLLTTEGLPTHPSPTRGRKIFEMQGCLACHKHDAFPRAQSTIGADLSHLGAKYATGFGKAWLDGFLRDPSHIARRTLMPQLPLEPASLPEKPRSSEGALQRPDPVADIVAFLLDVPAYQPTVPDYRSEDLDQLALAHLTRIMPHATAAQTLREGLSDPAASQFGADTALLTGKPTVERKLRYVGRRTIAKRGCYACHDIPGFDEAPPIGPALNDWGRKHESLLAFEQVEHYLAKSSWATSRGDTDSPPAGKSAQLDSAAEPFYTDAIRHQRREGFLWQKLREPRSFDYEIAAGKPFNQWLTMGQFDFTAEEREAIATFVLGLTGKPPTEKYVYRAAGQQRAMVEGRQVLDRFACAECHALRMEEWSIAYDPEEFEPPPARDTFDWLMPRFSKAAIEASLAVDPDGLARATLAGIPQLDADGHLAIVDEDEDAEGNSSFLYAFSLWEPTVLAGEVCAIGGADVLVWSHQIAERRAPWGGTLARLLYPAALANARAAGANPIGPEAWGWLPPPLAYRGAAVRPDWLHEYLLRPYPLRPASMMRMPQYSLSPDEAGKLVNFFTATAGARFPYPAPSPRRLRDVTLTPERQERFSKAMRMLLDTQTYCATCHQIGDYRPGGAVRTALAPDLTQVAPRLRADFLHRWLAGPTSVLPYTGMPDNFPPSGQSLDPIRFPGNSVEQLDNMTDLLLNFDWYLRQRQSIRDFMQTTGDRAKDVP